MEIIKISESYNPIFKRKEFLFFIDNISQSTPKLNEIRGTLAKKQNVSEDLVYILWLNTKTGTNRSQGKAEIYDSAEIATKIVPKHIQMRNIPTRREKKESKEEPKKESIKKKKEDSTKTKTAEPKKE